MAEGLPLTLEQVLFGFLREKGVAAFTSEAFRRRSDNGFDDMGHGSHRGNSMSDKGSSDEGLDFKNIANPVSAYFFLSDDVQDEINRGKRKT